MLREVAINKWYYAFDGLQKGPITFDELRMLAASGVLKPHHLVWQPEFGDNWHRAEQVAELFATPAPPPPPYEWRQPVAEPAFVGVDGHRPSAFKAAAHAYERVVTVLFRPFNLNRWFSIGFCAWLAYLGVGGGSSGPNFPREQKSELPKQIFDNGLEKLLVVFSDTMQLAGVVLVLAFFILFAIVLCKLRSRGDFMLLHRWYQPDTPVGECWRASRAAGHNLFVWRIGFFVVATSIFATILASGWFTLLTPYITADKSWSPALNLPAALFLSELALWLLALQVIAHLTKAFVVPIMYWHGVPAGRAWRSLLSLCNQYPFAIISYLLCGICCATLAFTLFLLFGLLTCCIGFIPMMLPYLGTVVLLPYFYFFRGYAVCFISQWRSDLIPEKYGGAHHGQAQ